MKKYLESIAIVLLVLLFLPGESDAQANYEVRSLEFKGVQTLSTGLLETAISTYAVGGFSKTFLGKEPFLYSEDILKTDLKRLVRFYQREGFLYAGATVADLDINAKKRTVRITIQIDEGDSITVRNIGYRPFDTANALNPVIETLIQDRLRSSLLRPGRRFRDLGEGFR